MPANNDNDHAKSGASLTAGVLVNHYRIIEKIGAGGMGEVYLAEDIELSRRVALKFLPPHLCQDADCRARFKREAQAAAKLSHPNIVTIYEVADYHNRPFIAMEYVEGLSLDAHIKGKAPSLEKIVELTIQICEGLAKAHQAGIVHRDIKPSNILIDHDSRAKILDFGLAIIKGTDKLTKTGSTLGTLSYMSPEQTRGEKVDNRSDIFSFGAVLYEMITGQLPFKGDHEPAIIYSIGYEEPEPLARYKTGVPDELQRIVSKALAKSKDERYQHADELVADLKSAKRSFETPAATRTHSRSAWLKRKGVYFTAGLAVLAVAFVLIKVYGLKPADEPLDSLAVLPLQNLSGDSDQEYFSDGMTEALITELQNIKALRVISRTSVMRFKKTSEPLPEVAKKLTVKAIVEGSVLRDGDNVRITVQLIQASPEKHLWAGNFDRPMRNILALQSDVARAIAQEVRAIVTPEEQKNMASSRPINPEAHEAYLKGRFYWNKRTGPDLQKAIEYFDLAIEKDATYALAYAGLASTYVILPQFVALPSKEIVPKAEAAARRALQLDAKLAEVHAVLGLIKNDYEWDWAGAENEFRRAIEIDPNYPTAHHWYNELLVCLGRLDEAFAEIKRAQELDPLSPVINTSLAGVLYNMGKYGEATDQLKQVLELDYSFVVAHNALGNVYEAQGKFDEAIAEYEKVKELEGNNPFFAPTSLGRAFARAGRRGEALRILHQLLQSSAQRGKVSFNIAFIYLGLGDKDKTFEWLDRAYQERAVGLLYAKKEPLWESVRSDPRFTELLRIMKLE